MKVIIAAFLLITASPLLAQLAKTSSLVDADEGVLAPPGFKVSVVTSEPMIAKSSAMCFTHARRFS